MTNNLQNFFHHQYAFQGGAPDAGPDAQSFTTHYTKYHIPTAQRPMGGDMWAEGTNQYKCLAILVTEERLQVFVSFFSLGPGKLDLFLFWMGWSPIRVRTNIGKLENCWLSKFQLCASLGVQKTSRNKKLRELSTCHKTSMQNQERDFPEVAANFWISQAYSLQNTTSYCRPIASPVRLKFVTYMYVYLHTTSP